MSRRENRRTRKAARVRVTRIVLLSAGALVLVAVASAAWVGIRLALSSSELTAARSEAGRVIAAVSADPSSAASDADRIEAVGRRLDDARGLVSDPIWRAVEFVPFAGPNLQAYRFTVEALHETVAVGLAPVLGDYARLESAVSLAERSVDTAAIAESASTLRASADALDRSSARLTEAKSRPVLPVLGSGIREASEMVDGLRENVDALAVAARILPAAFGAQGQRTYAVLLNNNAELRTTGGIAGAITELATDKGAIALGRQLTPDDLNPAQGSGLPVTSAEKALFGDRLGEYIQDVNLTPDFARAGALTAAHWQAAQGARLDGVVSIDTATIGQLLAATGPITVHGRELNSENAAKVLLRDVYLDIPTRELQDDFFAEVTRAMFDKLFSSGTKIMPLLSALSTATNEGRISVWFADDALQGDVAGTALAGPLAQLTDDGAPVGVFLADGTAGKMSVFLDGSVTATCNAAKSGRTITASAKLTSTAPENIASFPWFVTGPGVPGVPAGHIRTMVQFAATDALEAARVTIDGRDVPYTSRTIDGRLVAVAWVDLAPGASSVATADFTVRPDHTPTVHRVIATPTATAFEHRAEPGNCG